MEKEKPIGFAGLKEVKAGQQLQYQFCKSVITRRGGRAIRWGKCSAQAVVTVIWVGKAGCKVRIAEITSRGQAQLKVGDEIIADSYELYWPKKKEDGL